MSMGEKLEGQRLSGAFQGWVQISSSVAPALEHGPAWAHVPKHIPLLCTLLRGQILLLLLFKFECGASAFRELGEGGFED